MPENDVLVNGMALNNMGLTETNTINGYGLNTFGLIWECGSFWFGPYLTNNATIISTTWSALGASITTSWTLCGSTISTSWTLFTTTDQSCTEI